MNIEVVRGMRLTTAVGLHLPHHCGEQVLPTESEVKGACLESG